MAIPEWPNNLPQYPMREGFSVEYEDNIVRSPTDIGPGKQRPRSTLEVAKVSARLYCADDSKRDAVMAFHTQTLKQGVLRFTWQGLTDRLPLDYERLQFAAKPKIIPEGIGWVFELQLLALPA